MVKPNPVERRRHPRVSLGAPVAMGDEQQGLFCYLMDISQVGAKVILNQPLREMEVLGLEARIEYENLPEVQLSGQGIVIRCDPLDDGRYEAGIYFHELAETSRLQLEAFIEAMTSATTGC
ncbi:MAG: PilZ domain-containing protein [Planctomycetes bacterium]|nr:PilZ domain-containing protein [Planctomycetota bacterium]